MKYVFFQYKNNQLRRNDENGDTFYISFIIEIPLGSYNLLNILGSIIYEINIIFYSN